VELFGLYTAAGGTSVLNPSGLSDALSPNLPTYGFDRPYVVQTTAVDSALWYNPDGTINYPPNYGAIPGTERIALLQPGVRLGRYGGYGAYSDFVSAPGASIDSLSLPPYTNTLVYQEFVVVKPIQGAIQSLVSPWGGALGFGTQYHNGWQSRFNLSNLGNVKIVWDQW
jgi:hypothetical protein